MRMRFIPAVLIAMFAIIAAGSSSAQKAACKTNQIVLTVHPTAPTNGKAMYAAYCAVCHGENGQGSGPLVSRLQVQPVDLTLQSQNNHGKYPWAHIAAVLQYGAQSHVHGAAAMPAWGAILGKMDRTHPDATQLRIHNLNRYVESLQMK